MVYKRYIKREGKVFGPYYYKSYRDKDGNTRTTYVSPEKSKQENRAVTGFGLGKEKKMIGIFVIGLILLFVAGFFILKYSEMNKQIRTSPEEGGESSAAESSSGAGGGESAEGSGSSETDSSVGESAGAGGEAGGQTSESGTGSTGESGQTSGGEAGTGGSASQEENGESSSEGAGSGGQSLEGDIGTPSGSGGGNSAAVLSEETQEGTSSEGNQGNTDEGGQISGSGGQGSSGEIVLPEDNQTLNETIINETLENVTLPNETTGNFSLPNESGENFSLPENNQTLENITIPNETCKNITFINETTGNLTTILNESCLNKTFNLNENKSLVTDLRHEQIIIGMPVQWKKKVSYSGYGAGEEIEVDVPEIAENIEIEEIQEEGISLSPEVKRKFDLEKFLGKKSFVVRENAKEGGFFDRIINLFFGRFKGLFFSPPENEGTKTVSVKAKEAGSNERKAFQIVYTTPAPVAVEEETQKGKKIIISGPDELHYENVLAFSALPENWNIKSEEEIKLKWIEGGQFVPFSIEDKDGNGIYDYIKWVVLSLSNQTYEIILITKAEHLDENRTILSDIYESVRELDGSWSEEISDGHYIRVTFEQNLTRDRDITIYPRIAENSTLIIDGREVPYEIYLKKKRIEEIRRELNG